MTINMYLVQRMQKVMASLPSFSVNSCPKFVKISEVSPTDGFFGEEFAMRQNEKVEFINMLSKVGFPSIETTVYGHPSYLPKFYDSGRIGQLIERNEKTKYFARIFDADYTKKFFKNNFDGMSFSIPANEQILKSHEGITLDHKIGMAKEIFSEAKSKNLLTRAYINYAFGTTGIDSMQTKLKVTKRIIETMHELSVDEIILMDNEAVCNFTILKNLIEDIKCDSSKIGMHFHESRTTGLEMVLFSLSRGYSMFEASVGGIGGVPESPLGNIPTEDLMFVLDILGIQHNLDRKAVFAASEMGCKTLQKECMADIKLKEYESLLDMEKERFLK